MIREPGCIRPILELLELLELLVLLELLFIRLS